MEDGFEKTMNVKSDGWKKEVWKLLGDGICIAWSLVAEAKTIVNCEFVRSRTWEEQATFALVFSIALQVEP